MRKEDILHEEDVREVIDAEIDERAPSGAVGYRGVQLYYGDGQIQDLIPAAPSLPAKIDVQMLLDAGVVLRVSPLSDIGIATWAHALLAAKRIADADGTVHAGVLHIIENTVGAASQDGEVTFPSIVNDPADSDLNATGNVNALTTESRGWFHVQVEIGWN